MTFSGRIRLLLILVALLPPLVLLWSIYSTTNEESKKELRQASSSGLTKLDQYIYNMQNDIVERGQLLARSDDLKSHLRYLQRGQSPSKNLPIDNFDFAELTDLTGKVISSANRPGLIGQIVDFGRDSFVFPTIEYDLAGRHPAMTTSTRLGKEFILNCGYYLDNDFIEIASLVSDAEVKIEIDSFSLPVEQMEPGELFQFGDSLHAIFGGDEKTFRLIASFPANSSDQKSTSLLKIASVLTALSVLLAILLGFYLTGKSKREVENLRQAAARIAGGDLDTPVMAYSEGEFSELADAMTDMTIKLKATRRQLTATEKIAAWQSMGRQIAHEIKNPLTPLSISVDDLRRSHIEKQPDFDKILLQTTSTIKSEVKRLTELLDQFVSFARMPAPVMKTTTTGQIVAKLENVYKQNLIDKSLSIISTAHENKIYVDQDQIEQVLLNVINNALQTSEQPTVTLNVDAISNELVFDLEDNGPGFSSAQLDHGFEPYVTTKEGGTGLGIIISQRIIYDHGGSVEFSNRESGGARILVRLPLYHG